MVLGEVEKVQHLERQERRIDDQTKLARALQDQALSPGDGGVL